MIKLYYAPHTCSLASHIALEDAAADYSTVRINFAADEQRKPEYLAINPKVTRSGPGHRPGHSDRDARDPRLHRAELSAARLAPLDDPFLFAQVQAFNSYLCSTLHVAHAHRMRGYRWADEPAAIEAMQRKVPQSVAACFELIERKCSPVPWVMGERYTICDPYLFTMAQWLEEDGVDPSRFPKVMDHRRRMSERPEVQKAIAEELA